MSFLRCSLGAMAVGTGLFLGACASNSNSDTPPQRGSLIGVPTTVGSIVTASELDATVQGLGLQALTGAAKCEVTVAQINYRTAGVQVGEMTNASAAVLIPGGANCPGPFPLVAYARGTNLDKAHAMANSADPETSLLMAFFASQGYAVVATDYLGYALSNHPYHPYQHSDSEASAVVDSIRAARIAAPSLALALNGKVMVTGYSQGGHAAMAAQRAMERDNPAEFNLVAATHMAGAYRISASLMAGATNPIAGVQLFVPFQIVSWQKAYGNVYDKASDVFNAPYDGYIENLMPFVNYPSDGDKLPGGTPEEARDAMFKPAYLTDLVTNPSNGTIVAAKRQDLLGWDPKAVTILCGGIGDPTVKFAVNAQPTYDDFRSRGGSNVTLVDVDGEIQQQYGSVLAATPDTYYANYHGKYEEPFCLNVAKEMFDLYR